MEPLWVNEDKLLSAENDYFIYEFYINLMETAKQKSREETQNIKKVETQKITMETHQITKVAETEGKETGYKISRWQKVK